MTKYHCFPACLVSFFSDLQISLTQTEIVERCPKEFNKGNSIEGAINSYSLLKDNTISNEFGIKIQVYPPVNIKLNKYESVFLFVEWEGKSTDNHCVRFCHKTTKHIYFMNPSYGKINHRDSNTLLSWITIPLLITKI
jgi:hypothetical protein